MHLDGLMLLVIGVGLAAAAAALGDPGLRSAARRRLAGNSYRPEGLVRRTSGGLAVRSGAEVLIAEELEHAGIRYSYELSVSGGDGSRRLPDFTVYGPGGQSWYIEYLGMLDDRSYRDRVRRNRQWYDRWAGGRAIFLTGSGPALRGRVRNLIDELCPLGLALEDRRAS